MKRIYIHLILGLFISLFFVGFIPQIASAGVNNFSFSSFDADYYLSKDSVGHSTMKVVESLTAEFQNQNQNKGIERAIPSYYDGHLVSFNLVSLIRNGQPEPIFDQTHNGDFTVVSTGTDSYVNGTQKYVFTYTLRDVTKTFGDHQELYWDTNGTGWTQSFGKLNARVHLDNSVRSAFTGSISCYKGAQGSNDKCTGKNQDGVIALSSNGPLGGGENLTFDLSFMAGTFAGYEMTPLDYASYVFILVAGLLFIPMIYLKIRYGRNQKGRGTIIPEYLPPDGVSVLLSAEITDKAKNASTAQIIDLAVRHKIMIEETEKDALFGKTKEYTLELINADNLLPDEPGVIDAIFGGHQIGAKYTFNKFDPTMFVKMKELIKLVSKESTDKGLRLKQTKITVLFYVFMVLIIMFAVGSMIVASNSGNSTIIIFGFLVFFIPLLFVGVFKMYNLTPLTIKGRELFDYLKGLKMYIKLVEAERLKVLQSPEGAERKPVDINDGTNMIVLYERVLPYAVLFGQEKEWLKRLGSYYENNHVNPGWYSGINGFNAALFVSSVSSFSSYANSSSFSSGSGAGGGGFSGGGGGGGGGGGR